MGRKRVSVDDEAKKAKTADGWEKDQSSSKTQYDEVATKKQTSVGEEPVSKLHDAFEECLQFLRPWSANFVARSALIFGSLFAFWVVFVPRCLQEPVPGKCTYFGLTVECLPAFDEEYARFAEVGHWFVSLSLWGLAIFYGLQIKDLKAEPMRATCAMYSLITGFFALFRLKYGIGRPLLIGAAIHNLAEWWIGAMITQKTGDNRKLMMKVTAFFIAFICLVVLKSSDIKTAVLIEQSLGIMNDFCLVLCFTDFVVFSESLEVRKFYFQPFLAVVVHLFLTILPLVFANFAVGGINLQIFVYTNEIMVYLSAGFTHYTYLAWSKGFDLMCKPDNAPPNSSYRVHGVVQKYFIGFLLGLIPLVLVPLGAGQCEAFKSVTGTSVANVHPGLEDAFKEHIWEHGLIKEARKAPGNVDYQFYQNSAKPSEFRFVETWASQDALLTWLKSDTPKDVFEKDEVTKQMMVGGALELDGPYAIADPAADNVRVGHIVDHTEPTHGGFYFTVGGSCKDAWAVVSNWNDCSWVKGCREAVIDPKNPMLRRLYMESPQPPVLLDTLEGINHENMELQYALRELGYTGKLSLTDAPDGTGCGVTYTFDVRSNMEDMKADAEPFTVEAVNGDFLKNRVPYLKTLFSAQ